MRFVSSSSYGLWSLEMSLDLPELQIVIRESPAFATTRCVSVIKHEHAVQPLKSLLFSTSGICGIRDEQSRAG